MASYNRIVMIGNLTRDPETKQVGTQNVCRFSLAVNRSYKNKQTNAIVQEVCYIDVDVWGAQADSCQQYLQKGRPALVEGRLKLDSWTVDGQMKSKHSIVADRVVFLGTNAQAGQDEPTNEVTSPLEQDLLDQIDSIKTRMDSKAKKAPSIAAKKVDNLDEFGAEFKDVQPFQDDLPF